MAIEPVMPATKISVLPWTIQSRRAGSCGISSMKAYIAQITTMRISACSCSESSRVWSRAQTRRRPPTIFKGVTGRAEGSPAGPGGRVVLEGHLR